MELCFIGVFCFKLIMPFEQDSEYCYIWKEDKTPNT